MGKRRSALVHPVVRECLGYGDVVSDDEIIDDWRKRSTQVCKPCWELKYCPYGPLVEQSPLLPQVRREAKEHNEYIERCLRTGTLGSVRKLDDALRKAYERILGSADEGIQELASVVYQKQYIEKAIDEAASKGSEDPFLDVFSFEPGPIKDYRLPYAFYIAGEEHIEITPELQEGIQQEIEKMEKALELGVVDETRPLDDVMRRCFRKQIESFNEKDYPVAIPREISEMECNVFGHICPVVFVGGDVSETSQERRKNRYIPFQTKARVVRRDNYTCQECGKHLRDNEVEFDHIIPLSKGGSSEEHNIRLTCFECNRSKSDSVDI